LHVEEQVEIIQCRICTADQTVHSNFEQLVDMLEFSHNYREHRRLTVHNLVCYTNSTLKNFH